MKYFIKVVKAEMMKQKKNYFYNKTIYISLFLWPLLSFASAFYGYTPFQISKAVGVVDYLNEGNLLIFVLIGYTTMMFFRTLVQSAWMFSFERTYGTLELIYLSPANRLGFVLGNAVASLMGSVWLFLVFAGGIFFLQRSSIYFHMESAIIGIAFMLVLSVLWGMLLNSLFLFSRDTAFLFTVLEEPMELFAGAKIPTAIFPFWAKIISAVFPLTYSVDILRRVFLRGDSIDDLKGFLSISVLLGVLMLSITVLSLKAGERHAKKTGNMALF